MVANRTFWSHSTICRWLAQRPGAFEHAQPLRQWRQSWPPAYETLLSSLRQQQASESQAIRTFIEILQLHQTHAPDLIQAAVEQALREGLTTPAGVRFCLNRLLDPTPVVAPLDLSATTELAAIGRQARAAGALQPVSKGGERMNTPSTLQLEEQLQQLQLAALHQQYRPQAQAATAAGWSYEAYLAALDSTRGGPALRAIVANAASRKPTSRWSKSWLISTLPSCRNSTGKR